MMKTKVVLFSILLFSVFLLLSFPTVSPADCPDQYMGCYRPGDKEHHPGCMITMGQCWKWSQLSCDVDHCNHWKEKFVNRCNEQCSWHCGPRGSSKECITVEQLRKL